jgi:hypothetical protein
VVVVTTDQAAVNLEIQEPLIEAAVAVAAPMPAAALVAAVELLLLHINNHIYTLRICYE